MGDGQFHIACLVIRLEAYPYAEGALPLRTVDIEGGKVPGGIFQGVRTEIDEAVAHAPVLHAASCQLGENFYEDPACRHIARTGFFLGEFDMFAGYVGMAHYGVII